MIDTRNGIGYSKSFEIQYDGLRKIGEAPDGLDKYVFFETVPWVITKTTWQYIEPMSFWDGKISQMKRDYIKLANSYSGEFIESVNVGERLIINGEESFAGSYTIANYGSSLGSLPNKYKLFEWSGGQIPHSGYWEDGGGTLSGKSVFSTSHYGSVGYKSYSAASPEEKVGDKGSVGGVNGIVSSVDMSNPRYIGTKLIYDITVQVSSKTGTKISV